MRVRLLLHEDLDTSDLRGIGLMRTYVSDTLRERLRDCTCVEICLDELLDDDGVWERARALLDDCLLRVCLGSLGHSYLVQLSLLSVKGRVRSYKGLFPKGEVIKQGEWAEAEVDRGNESFFVGFAKLSAANANECIASSRDSDRSFIFISKHDSVDSVKDVLLEPLLQCLHFGQQIVDITHDLIPLVVSREGIICSNGWDPNGRYVCANLFVRQSLTREIVVELERILQTQHVRLT